MGTKEPVIVRQPGKVAIPEGRRVSLQPRPGDAPPLRRERAAVQAPLAAE
jgi:hypothetical protein